MRLLQTLVGLGAIGIATQAHAQLTTRPAPLGGGGEAIVYRDQNFSGAGVNVARARPDLGLAWQVRSIRITRGTWELCSKPNFEGSCTRLDRSRASLPQAQRTVRSMRPVYDSGWELVGESDVRDRTERDTLISWGHVKHRRMRVCVEGHSVRFYDLEVVFFFNGKQNVPVRALVGDGQCTRDIDFGRGGKDLSLINMTYETFSLGSGRATVQVYAQR